MARYFFLEKMNISKSNELLYLGVRMDVSDLIIPLSRNIEICPKSKKKIHVNQASKMSKLGRTSDRTDLCF